MSQLVLVFVSSMSHCVILFFHVVVVFFFKQKTAYEMRISDWSSDVRSSDLRHHQRLRPRPRFGEPAIDEHLIDAGFRHRRSQRFGSGGAPACLAARSRNASIWITRSRVSIEWRRASSATLNA